MGGPSTSLLHIREGLFEPLGDAAAVRSTAETLYRQDAKSAKTDKGRLWGHVKANDLPQRSQRTA